MTQVPKRLVRAQLHESTVQRLLAHMSPALRLSVDFAVNSILDELEGKATQLRTEGTKGPTKSIVGGSVQ